MSEFKRRIISDIVPPSKKVIFSPLPPPPPRKHIDIPPIEITKTSHKRQKLFKFPKIKIFFWIFSTLLTYGLVSVVFAEMKVEITPKSFSVSLDETLELSKKFSPGKLVFSEISLSDNRSGSFFSSQKRSLESKAKGEITIMNKNSNFQVLVAGTRFESASGKIYKIEKGVIIPANGSLDAEVVAQNTGMEFNEENLVDFTIPGFKEQRSPKFNTVYAKSKTKITGGFSGATLVVGQEDVKNAKNSLLKDALFEMDQNLKRKTPDDSFLLAQSIRYNVVEENLEPKIGQAGEKFTLNLIGSAIGVVINKEELEKILGEKIPNYDNLSFHYKINNIEDISFELKDFKLGVSDFKLKVSGIAEFVGDIDSDMVRGNIFEKKLKKSSAILEDLSTASIVKVRFRPFWLRSFPDTKERIQVLVN